MAAAVRHPRAPSQAMREHVMLQWSAMDIWLEEDEVVHTHPRSPYVRIDALASSRHIKVVVGGVTIADSHQPIVLFETGLVPRYYLPRSDVRMDLLVATRTSTACPYKGVARYWSITIGDVELTDAVWCYETPFDESRRIGPSPPTTW